MSEQKRIATDNLYDYLNHQAHPKHEALFWGASDTAKRLMEHNPTAGEAAIISVLLNEWATTPAMVELAEQAYQYALAQADALEHDVERSPVPDTIEGLDE